MISQGNVHIVTSHSLCMDHMPRGSYIIQDINVVQVDCGEETRPV